MPSRQDQLHSYQFTVQRLVAALVTWETDPAQPPFRRMAGATLVGLLLAALGVGAAAALALVSPGDEGRWRDGKAVILEKETGALYVFRDGRLHPVVNYPSALLILNTPGARTVSVSRRSIAGAQRGAALGILGAPHSLPVPARLRRAPWTVCSHESASVLFVGDAPAGGTPLADQGLLLSTSDGAVYLLWKGHKHRIRQPEFVLPALVWSGRRQLKVAAAFLNALPSGVDLGRLTVAGRGGFVLAGRVGQVYVVDRAGGRDFFVATLDGLASLTAMQAALLLADPDAAPVQGQPGAVPMSPEQFAGVARGSGVRPFAADPTVGGLPANPPEVADVLDVSVCTSPAGPVKLDVPLPDLASAATTRAASAAGAVLADRIVVPPGAGALVRADGVAGGGLVLVTDLARRFPLPSADVLPALGYAGQAPVPVPAQIVALLPSGPALDPAAASMPVPEE